MHGGAGLGCARVMRCAWCLAPWSPDMLLRTRITGIAAAGLLFSALGLLGGSLLHEQLLRYQ